MTSDHGLRKPRRPELARLPRRRAWRWLIIVAVVIATIEGGAALALRLAQNPLQAMGLVWQPDLLEAQRKWVAESAHIDQDIGGNPFAAAKQSSSFSGERPCGAAYGDSFV